ncbi:uncharacterized protein LOC8262879 isoform X1 [Ricinus communis]|uniref:Uncharacterized protein n=1 Tax=Ricinus communis TaxID=3988 RepID=B9SC46_RICCO|nr:uncharacterized protein LOC8262879 isoform X1 [Ricinus communis]EEF38760.1 conserved hypothetical protein [Ricinus communis]|eukprot:XP_002523565.1 uncharacterized protein LOC8262879 [Ricinus communis]
MACLDMYNSEHQGQYCPPISPRISFSNDFADSQQIIKQERSSSSRSEAPVSTDFEFSVTNYSMMSADELFFKGRLLPFKDNGNNNKSNQMQRTIRDELLVDDDDGYHGVSHRPPKGSSTRWKGLLGLKRSHIGSKKVDKSSCDGSFGFDQNRRLGFAHEEMDVGKSSQELLSEGGSSHRDVEIGI